MEIEIQGKPRAEAIIDVDKFKEVLGTEWDLEKAVRLSTKVMYALEDVKLDNFVEFIYMALDWTEIIDNLKIFSGDEIKIELFKIKCRDMVTYDADLINPSTNLIKLNETRFNGEDVILKQSMIKNPAFTVRNYIINKIFNYSLKKNFKVVQDGKSN